jgi:hypothetical protein
MKTFGGAPPEASLEPLGPSPTINTSPNPGLFSVDNKCPPEWGTKKFPRKERKKRKERREERKKGKK